VSRTFVVITAALVIALITAAVVVAVVLDRDRDAERRDALFAATSTTGATSPYDLTELPPVIDLSVVAGASFVSILVPNEAGTLTSYGVSADVPAARELIEAILDAEEIDPESVTAPAGSASETSAAPAGEASSPTITFVLPTRETLTFVLDLDRGIIRRGERAWRPADDLRALIAAATAGPG
jgi:hypothetical protein